MDENIGKVSTLVETLASKYSLPPSSFFNLDRVLCSFFFISIESFMAGLSQVRCNLCASAFVHIGELYRFH